MILWFLNVGMIIDHLRMTRFKWLMTFLHATLTIYVLICWLWAGNNEFWEGFLLFWVFCWDFFYIWDILCDFFWPERSKGRKNVKNVDKFKIKHEEKKKSRPKSLLPNVTNLKYIGNFVDRWHKFRIRLFINPLVPGMQNFKICFNIGCLLIFCQACLEFRYLDFKIRSSQLAGG